jgi:hypothetical protein
MSIQAVAAIIAFVVLFSAWVIIPSQLRKRHTSKVEVKEEEE